MSVTYAIVLKNGEEGFCNRAGCFGGLQDGAKFVKWEIDNWDATDNPVSHVDFYLDSVDKDFCEYLEQLPFIQAGLMDVQLENVRKSGHTYQGKISVSADVNPHHLINIMSMYRTPWSFPEVTRTWKYLRSIGIRDDIAHVMAFYLRGNSADSIREHNTWCSEHSYFSVQNTKSCFKALVEYLSKEEPGAAHESEAGPFREIMQYTRANFPDGVVCQSIGYDASVDNNKKADQLVFSLTKTRRYVDIDEEKALEIKERYAALDSTPANEEAMYAELREAVTNSGEEQVNLLPEEMQNALIEFAQEYA